MSAAKPRNCPVCYWTMTRNAHGHYLTCKVCALRAKEKVAEFRRLKKLKLKAEAVAKKIAVARAMLIPKLKREPKRYVPVARAKRTPEQIAAAQVIQREKYTARAAEYARLGLNSKGRTPGAGWAQALDGLVMTPRTAE